MQLAWHEADAHMVSQGAGVGGTTGLPPAAAAAHEDGEVLLKRVGHREQPQPLRDRGHLAQVAREEQHVPDGEYELGADRVRDGPPAADGREEDAAEAAQAGLGDGAARRRRPRTHLHADQERAV